jgi:hypothetical protein
MQGVSRVQTGLFLINLILGAYGADFRHYWLIATTRRVVLVSMTSFWPKLGASCGLAQRAV